MVLAIPAWFRSMWSRSVFLSALLTAIAIPAAVAQSSAPNNAQTSPAPSSPALGGANSAGQQQPAPAPTDPSQPPQSGQQPGAQEPNGQEPNGNDQGMFVFKKQVQEVILHATVVDEHQHPVGALDKSAFTVFERGVQQAITSFRREDVPVAMGILVDNSGSMLDKREKITQAVMNLIRASNPQDEIFVVNFSQQPYLDQDFTSDANLLRAALHQVSARGSTALYDAIVASAVHLTNNHRLEKKVLLVITDGQDNMSQETLQEAARRLQPANGPALYAIGLLGSGLQERGRDALQYLSERTGGAAYFPGTLNEVDGITRAIAHDIRGQYTIAYRPQNQNAVPGYQSVQVEAHAPGYGKLTVRTRTGYYPGESTH